MNHRRPAPGGISPLDTVKAVRVGIAASGAAAFIFIVTSGTMLPVLALLPALYVAGNLLIPSALSHFRGNVGVTTINIVIFIRYVIAPCFWSINGYTSTRGVLPSLDAYNWAILLMGIELLTAQAAVGIFGSKLLRRTAAVRKTRPPLNTLPPSLLATLVSLVGLAFILILPSVRARYNFAFDAAALDTRATTEAPTAILMLADIALILTSLLVVSGLTRLHRKHGNVALVFIAIAACLPVMLTFKGSSRFSVLIPTVALLVVLSRAFPYYRRVIGLAVTAVGGAVLGALSLAKNFRPRNASATQPNTNTAYYGELLDAYFSGPMNLGRAIDIYGSNTSAFNFINDALANIAVLSRFADRNDTTTVAFNEYFYGTHRAMDQIVPLSGQSLIHFGLLGAPLLLAIAALLLVRMDSLIARERRVELIYGYVYVTVYLGCAMMLSFGSVFSSYTNVLLPLVIVMVACYPRRYWGRRAGA